MDSTLTSSGPSRLFAAFGAVLLVVGIGGCAGETQGGLEGASPGPGAVVGGEIDQIELFYDDIVVAADVVVVDPEGTELATETRVDTDVSVISELGGSLSEPGVYFVSHGVDAVDGDREEGSYSFTFDPAASPPGIVFSPEDDGTPWLLWIVAVAGVLVIAVLGWQFLQSVARAKRGSAREP